MEEEKQDSFTIGTPAKGGALKCYVNLKDLEETKKKIDNMLKLKIYLEDKGYMRG